NETNVELRPRHRCQIGGNERSPPRLNVGDEKRKPIETPKTTLRRHGSAKLRLFLTFLPAHVRSEADMCQREWLSAMGQSKTSGLFKAVRHRSRACCSHQICRPFMTASTSPCACASSVRYTQGRVGHLATAMSVFRGTQTCCWIDLVLRINRGYHDLPLVAQHLQRHVSSMPAHHQ